MSDHRDYLKTIRNLMRTYRNRQLSKSTFLHGLHNILCSMEKEFYAKSEKSKSTSE
jgi:hypothetical protein